MTLSAAERAVLAERIRIAREKRGRVTTCAGCGVEFPTTPRGRRYCTRACSNRHWHVRKKEADEWADYLRFVEHVEQMKGAAS